MMTHPKDPVITFRHSHCSPTVRTSNELPLLAVDTYPPFGSGENVHAHVRPYEAERWIRGMTPEQRGMIGVKLASDCSDCSRCGASDSLPVCAGCWRAITDGELTAAQAENTRLRRALKAIALAGGGSSHPHVMEAVALADAALSPPATRVEARYPCADGHVFDSTQADCAVCGVDAPAAALPTSESDEAIVDAAVRRAQIRRHAESGGCALKEMCAARILELEADLESMTQAFRGENRLWDQAHRSYLDTLARAEKAESQLASAWRRSAEGLEKQVVELRRALILVRGGQYGCIAEIDAAIGAEPEPK